MRTHQQIIIAHHLIRYAYGMWLPNDVRGSGSTEIREEKFEELGPIHFGRKKDQPSRDELKEFYKRANPLLKFEPIWFDSAKRQAIVDAYGQVVKELGYTVYASAVLQNHAHQVVRRHRDDAVRMWDVFVHASREAIRAFPDVDPEHPVWSDRPYKVFLYTPDDITGRIDYVNDNFTKHKLPKVIYPFVKAYDGWPHPRRRK